MRTRSFEKLLANLFPIKEVSIEKWDGKSLVDTNYTWKEVHVKVSYKVPWYANNSKVFTRLSEALKSQIDYSIQSSVYWANANCSIICAELILYERVLPNG